MAARFAERFGAAALGEVAGLLHDIGKMSTAFQGYIKGNGALKGPDHASAGAREAVRLFGPQLGRILAYCVAGHHAGLADGGSEHVPGTLSHRVEAKQIEHYAGWEVHAGALPERSAIRMSAALKAMSQYRRFALSPTFSHLGPTCWQPGIMAGLAIWGSLTPVVPT